MAGSFSAVATLLIFWQAISKDSPPSSSPSHCRQSIKCLAPEGWRTFNPSLMSLTTNINRLDFFIYQTIPKFLLAFTGANDDRSACLKVCSAWGQLALVWGHLCVCKTVSLRWHHSWNGGKIHAESQSLWTRYTWCIGLGFSCTCWAPREKPTSQQECVSLLMQNWPALYHERLISNEPWQHFALNWTEQIWTVFLSTQTWMWGCWMFFRSKGQSWNLDYGLIFFRFRSTWSK